MATLLTKYQRAGENPARSIFPQWFGSQVRRARRFSVVTIAPGHNIGPAGTRAPSCRTTAGFRSGRWNLLNKDCFHGSDGIRPADGTAD